jgi:L-lactate permease
VNQKSNSEITKLTLKCVAIISVGISILSITEDLRLQALLIAFSFGTFLEGAAGFGALRHPLQKWAFFLVLLPLKDINICS